MSTGRLDFAAGYQLTLSGSTLAPLSILPLIVSTAASCSLSGSGVQAYTTDPPLTIAGGATTTLNLTTGLTNPLGDGITGGNAFAHVYVVIIQHDPDSESSGITAFGGGGDDFQGWLEAASITASMPPSAFICMGIPDTETGMVVDGTHKEIAIENLDAMNAATVIVSIFGIKT